MEEICALRACVHMQEGGQTDWGLFDAHTCGLLFWWARLWFVLHATHWILHEVTSPYLPVYIIEPARERIHIYICLIKGLLLYYGVT